MWGWIWATIFCLEALQGLNIQEGEPANRQELRLQKEVRTILQDQGFEIVAQNLYLRLDPAKDNQKMGQTIAEFDLVIRRKGETGVILVELKNQLHFHQPKKAKKNKSPNSTIRQANRFLRFLEQSPFENEKVIGVFFISELDPDSSFRSWKDKGLTFFTVDSLKKNKPL